jgi:phosphoserine phosphatase
MTQMMSHALVLTSPPGKTAVDGRAIAAVRAHLARHTVIEERWLAEGEAWEALFVADEAEDLAPLRASVDATLAGRPIDANIVPDDMAYRRKRLLVADMESTIIAQECLDELAGYAGLRERISDITARAMRGELDFEAAIKERVALLAGLDAGLLHKVYADVTLMPGADVLVATMRTHGATCALVSGGFTFFTERVAQRLGFDLQQANTLHVSGGKIAGTVGEPILGREAKLAALQQHTQRLGLEPTLTMAVGDGANDLAMIGAAGLGVAFRAKPVVAAQARASVVHGDLTALLYLQGYHRDEFVPA